MKVLIIEFKDKEEKLFRKTIEWLHDNFEDSDVSLQKKQQELIMNPFTRTIINKNGDLVSLTSKEFDLLYFLYQHKGQVFSKKQLYENIWKFENISKDTRSIPIYIYKLRKKIEPVPDDPIYIITIRGEGYKFNEEKP